MIEQPYLPHETDPLIATRQDVLAHFSEQPKDDAIWRSAYDMVRAEGDAALAGSELTAAAAIPADDLIAFADEMRATPQAGRYALTTRVAPDGQYWFDVLRTFSPDQPELAKQAVLHGLLDSGYVFGRALDLGTGTGKSLATLESVAGRVVGLDRNPDLLALAAKKTAGHIELVRGQATELPFTDSSFDLISSCGLESSLSSADNESMYHEIARVLRPGGLYVISSTMPNESGYGGYEMEAICLTSKAMLADMIVDSISGGLEVEHTMTVEDYKRLLLNAGLTVHSVQVDDELDGVASVVNLFFKPEVKL